jgi:hypothetical protein
MESNKTEFYFIPWKKRLDIRYSYYFLLKKTVFFKWSILSFFPRKNFAENGQSVFADGLGSQRAKGRREEYRIPEIEPFCTQNTANALFLFTGWHAWIN